MHVLVDAFWKGKNRFPNKISDRYFDDLKKPKAACHLGAVYYGYTKKTSSSAAIELLRDFPELHNMVPLPCAPCVSTPETEGYVSAIIIHLSDHHTKRDWPDDKVAAWLETALTNAATA